MKDRKGEGSVGNEHRIKDFYIGRGKSEMKPESEEVLAKVKIDDKLT